MNKKGQDWLNVTEIVIGLLFIFIAFLLLNVAKTSEYVSAENRLSEYRTEYHNTQLLRTLLQTPIVIEERTMTFAQVANRYFEMEYQNYNDVGSDEEQDQRKKDIETYKTVLEDMTRNTVIDFLIVPSGSEVSIYLNFYLGEQKTRYGTLELGDAISFDKRVTTYIPIELYVPAYFEDLSQLPGSYHITLSLGSIRYITDYTNIQGLK